MTEYLEAQAVRHAICNVEIPDGVTEDQFYAVMNNVCGAVLKVPIVEAVPLDKLCEWLSENALDITRRNITPLKEDAEHWRKLITKWMEGLDAAD